ncbi:MAG: hypothetical protein H0W61_06310 [Bacteroidetes bacterium]|nr:hypothetical protein [Bacteroidota bacterium]
MHIKVKKVIIVAGLVILCVHFTLLLMYSFKKDKYSFFYMYPYFHQNWNVFVPPPSSNYNLYAVYENSGLQRTDIFTEIVTAHQANRFAGKESFVLALSNSIHYFETEKNPDVSGNNFKMIKSFVKNYLEGTRSCVLKNLKLILVVKSTGSTAPRVYTN